jgi:hypothetical protein
MDIAAIFRSKCRPSHIPKSPVAAGIQRATAGSVKPKETARGNAINAK